MGRVAIVQRIEVCVIPRPCLGRIGRHRSPVGAAVSKSESIARRMVPHEEPRVGIASRADDAFLFGARTTEKVHLLELDRGRGLTDNARVDVGGELAVGFRERPLRLYILDELVWHLAVLVADKVGAGDGVEDGVGNGVVETGTAILHAGLEVTLKRHRAAVLRPLINLEAIATRLGLSGSTIAMVVGEDIETPPGIEARKGRAPWADSVHCNGARAFACAVRRRKCGGVVVHAVLFPTGLPAVAQFDNRVSPLRQE